VVFTLADLGGAHVSITLFIQGFPPIEHDESFQGARDATVNLAAGTYACKVLVAAFKFGALNAHYDTTVSANGTAIALTSGNVPTDEDSDIGFVKFDLIAA
jgi:hypothetical protein